MASIERPRLLDLFCGGGGASMGYYYAGFDITGVDIEPHKNYPFKFVQADAIKYLSDHGSRFDAFHSSPPCQFATTALSINKRSKELREKHINYIPVTREALVLYNKPYVIENVPGAIQYLNNPILLCGTMFDIKVVRHRYFETNFNILQLEHFKHIGRIEDGDYIGVYGNGGGIQRKIVLNSDLNSVNTWREAMEAPWMSKKELAEAIPPAYTEYIGNQIMRNCFGRQDLRRFEMPPWIVLEGRR